jgi:replicative DNA helicase
MSRQEALLISALVDAGSLRPAIRGGINESHFSAYREEWDWIKRQKAVPSRTVFRTQFPDFRWRSTKPSDVPAIIDSLKENHAKTQVALVIERAAKKMRTSKGVPLAETLMDEIQEILKSTSDTGATEVITSSSRWISEFRKKRRLALQGKILGISTGLPTIDERTGGLLDSMLYIVIARQGNAKTYLMLLWAMLALINGKRVLWVSREMPEDMVAYRIHSIAATQMRGPDHTFSNLGIVLGREDIDFDDYRKFLREIRGTIKGRLFIPDEKTVSIKRLESLVEIYHPDVVFYDYIGILADADVKGWQSLGVEANAAKTLAMKYRIPFIMASQVNRAAKDVSEAPMVENISFSDSIGYAADLVFALQLSSLDSDDPFGPRYLDIWVRKARYGFNEFHVNTEFDGDRGVIREIGSPKDLAFEGLGKKRKKIKRVRRGSSDRSREDSRSLGSRQSKNNGR